MSGRGTIDVRPGSRLWWQGSAWQVDAVDSHGVLLRHDHEVARVELSALVGSCSPLDGSSEEHHTEPSDLGAVVLSSLPAEARRAAEVSAAEMSRLLEGGGPTKAALVATAERLGISVRTLQRRVAAYSARGIDGLVDYRVAGLDARPASILAGTSSPWPS